MYVGQRWLRLIRTLHSCCSQCSLRNKQCTIMYFQTNLPINKIKPDSVQKSVTFKLNYMVSLYVG